jgi:hypothetical protein
MCGRRSRSWFQQKPQREQKRHYEHGDRNAHVLRKPCGPRASAREHDQRNRMARARHRRANHAKRAARGHGRYPVTLVAVYPRVLIAAIICASVTFAGSYVTTAVPFS